MTPSDRASLAEGLLSNPLFIEMLAKLEANAIERMINANTEILRHECQLRVQAVRHFRSDCASYLRSNHEPKSAPA